MYRNIHKMYLKILQYNKMYSNSIYHKQGSIITYKNETKYPVICQDIPKYI